MREPVSQAQPHGSVTASATHSGGNRRSLWVSMAIAFVAVMILEVGFFNLGHWRTSRLQAATVGKVSNRWGITNTRSPIQRPRPSRFRWARAIVVRRCA